MSILKNLRHFVSESFLNVCVCVCHFVCDFVWQIEILKFTLVIESERYLGCFCVISDVFAVFLFSPFGLNTYTIACNNTLKFVSFKN